MLLLPQRLENKSITIALVLTSIIYIGIGFMYIYTNTRVNKPEVLRLSKIDLDIFEITKPSLPRPSLEDENLKNIAKEDLNIEPKNIPEIKPVKKPNTNLVNKKDIKKVKHKEKEIIPSNHNLLQTTKADALEESSSIPQQESHKSSKNIENTSNTATSNIPKVLTQENSVNNEDFIKIKKAIVDSLKYPMMARKRGLEGIARIKFDLDSNGVASNEQLLQSSGQGILDKAAIEAIKNAAGKFPKGNNYSIIIPIAFKLTK